MRRCGRRSCAPHFPDGRAADAAAAIHAAESALWRQAGAAQPQRHHRPRLRARRGGAPARLLPDTCDAWAPHTYADPDGRTLSALHARGIKVGVLSNTMWPGRAHEDVFPRDSCSTSSTAPSTPARSRSPSRIRTRSARPCRRRGDRPARACSSGIGPSMTSTAPSGSACARCCSPTATCPRTTGSSRRGDQPPVRDPALIESW